MNKLTQEERIKASSKGGKKNLGRVHARIPCSECGAVVVAWWSKSGLCKSCYNAQQRHKPYPENNGNGKGYHNSCHNPNCGKKFMVEWPAQYYYCPICRIRAHGHELAGNVRLSPIYKKQHSELIIKEGKWWVDQPTITRQLENYYGSWWV